MQRNTDFCKCRGLKKYNCVSSVTEVSVKANWLMKAYTNCICGECILLDFSYTLKHTYSHNSNLIELCTLNLDTILFHCIVCSSQKSLLLLVQYIVWNFLDA